MDTTNRILIHHSKHGDIYFRAFTKEEMIKAMWTIFTNNDTLGYYNYPEKHKETADEIRTTKNSDLMMKFLLLRSNQDYEYEQISTEHLIS
ncbi:MAG: hypothetical protein KDC68_01030 [Gelidibacter sp.]|nr:hypothetical protein [Gelidibacter sp.]